MTNVWFLRAELFDQAQATRRWPICCWSARSLGSVSGRWLRRTATDESTVAGRT
jgi:hypothetical protein